MTRGARNREVGRLLAVVRALLRREPPAEVALVFSGRDGSGLLRAHAVQLSMPGVQSLLDVFTGAPPTAAQQTVGPADARPLASEEGEVVGWGCPRSGAGMPLGLVARSRCSSGGLLIGRLAGASANSD